MASLPQSDAVAQMKIRQLLSEAMPRILGNNPSGSLKSTPKSIAFKTRTGLDPRKFEQIALGHSVHFPGGGSNQSANRRTCKRSVQLGGDGRRGKSCVEWQISRREVPGENDLHFQTQREHSVGRVV